MYLLKPDRAYATTGQLLLESQTLRKTHTDARKQHGQLVTKGKINKYRLTENRLMKHNMLKLHITL